MRQRKQSNIRLLTVCLLICCTTTQVVWADTVTYQQLRQDQWRGAAKAAPAQPGAGQSILHAQDPREAKPSVEIPEYTVITSQDRPEFTRLADGRIVPYGSGPNCDGDCVEPVEPGVFRGHGPSIWWIATPLVAGGVLCAILCRGGGNSPQPLPNISIPTSQPTQPNLTTRISQPPTEVPEPGTLVLVGLGIAALVARRKAVKSSQSSRN